MAVNLDIIAKSGSWFSYNGERIGQGRENVKKYLMDNPDIMQEVDKKVRDNFAKAFEQSLGEEIPENAAALWQGQTRSGALRREVCHGL